MDGQVANGRARRHPRWGVVAQVTGAVGVVLLVLMIAGTWLGYSYTDQGVHGLVGDMDAAAAKAVEQANAVAVALDQQAAQSGNDPTPRRCWSRERSWPARPLPRRTPSRARSATCRARSVWS